MAQLRDAAAKARQAAGDDAQQRRLQHTTRQLRRRTFDDGSIGGPFKLPAMVGAQVWALFDRLTDHRFDEQRRAGIREPRDAYAADGLCLAVGVQPAVHPDHGENEQAGPVGDSPPPAQPVSTPDGEVPRTGADPPAGASARVVPEANVNLHKELVVIIDADSLRNGVVGVDGTCEIPGVGPVPVHAARDLLGEAGLNLVIKDGVDIANVTLGGRRLSKSMRLAMLAAHGWRCGDCGSPYRLEGDHDTPYAVSRHTRLLELGPRCPVCHKRKTKREAAQTAAAGRHRAAEARRAQRRAAAALIGALTVILLARGP